MKVWLNTGDEWKLFEGDDLSGEFAKRNIFIGERAVIGERAYIGEGAVIRERAVIGAEVVIGAVAYIGERVHIGAGADIGVWAYIGERAVIGAKAVIRERAVIREGAVIGEGAVIKKTSDCIVMGPLGSRNAMLTCYKSDGQIYAATGCFCDTVSIFIEAIKKTHGDNEHATRYEAVIEFAKSILK